MTFRKLNEILTYSIILSQACISNSYLFCWFFIIIWWTSISSSVLSNIHNNAAVESIPPENNTKDLYVYGIVQNAADYNEGDIVLRLGFLKD